MHAPGLTPRAVLEKFTSLQMLDAHFPTVDGRWLIFARYTQPEKEHRLLLAMLGLELPAAKSAADHQQRRVGRALRLATL